MPNAHKRGIDVNKQLVRYVLGWVFIVIGAMLCLPIAVAFIYKEKDFVYFGLLAAACLLIGLVSVKIKPKNTQMYLREGYLSCALTWILLSVIGCLPFYISGSIPSFTDALFESVSGFTTTGASILGVDRKIEELSHSMLFWRSFTNWAGGMGILVFMLAVISQLSGQSNMYLMKAESPGPVVSKLIPKLRGTAGVLYGIYAAMTLIEFIMLAVGGMPLFDALTLSFSTAGTGGFSIKNAGLMAYEGHYYWQAVVTVFMFLFAVNFSVYYLIITKKFKQAILSEELRWYAIIFAAAVIIIGLDLTINKVYENPFDVWHHAAFQVATFESSTGFASKDFDLWPSMSRTTLMIVALIGACAGSTGGGLKVSRVIVLVRSAKRDIRQMLHPNSVYTVKMDGKAVKEDTVRSINVYLSIFVFIFAVSVCILSLDEKMDFATNFTAVIATINNMGPGLAGVGPTKSFFDYSSLSKYVLIFDMLAGRLELLPMLLLFNPECWSSKR